MTARRQTGQTRAPRRRGDVATLSLEAYLVRINKLHLNELSMRRNPWKKHERRLAPL